ncbi:hypothetical protein GGE06_002829 [Streptomyces sp. SFB5A]|uniref:Uncharacterized protein n=1 Tax=Streptomyces nymphaeiformis TaxID=2663842 RepID=A0A7W7XAV9_9ACTN|nr:hypothetical protein [Streptomyces nymphaeiformis]
MLGAAVPYPPSHGCQAVSDLTGDPGSSTREDTDALPGNDVGLHDPNQVMKADVTREARIRRRRQPADSPACGLRTSAPTRMNSRMPSAIR